MRSSENTKIMKIDHRNSLTEFNYDRAIYLVRQLNNSNNDTLNNNTKSIYKFLEKIIPEFTKDSLIICKKLSVLILKENKHMLVSRQKISDLIYQLSDLNNEFILNEEKVVILVKILSSMFYNIDKVYKLYTYNDFIKRLNLNNDTTDNTSFNLNQTFDFNSSLIDKLRKSSKFSALSSDAITIFQKMQPKLPFPEELKELSAALQNVKSLKIQIPQSEISLNFYILIMLNLSWIFPNILEVQYDIDKIQTKVTNKNKPYKEVKKGKNKYILMVLFSFFISKLKIKSLSLKIYDSYLSEIDYILKLEKIFVNNFHFLDFLDNMNNLTNLDIGINALDSYTYKKIQNIISRNLNLRNLSLKIFPDDEYFTKENLIKLSNLMSINIQSKQDSDPIIDKSEFIMNKLIFSFEDNMENLFFLLSVKLTNLNSLNISFDLPNMVISNDKYVNVLHKFMFNIIISLNNESSNLQTLELSSNNLPMDSRKYPNIHKMLDSFNFLKNQSLINLTLNFRMNKLEISKFFPTCLEYLKINELDHDSFTQIINYLTNNPFKELKFLHIGLSNPIFDIQKQYNKILEFLSIKKGYKLEEIILNCNITINNEFLDKIYDIINKDSIQSYYFTFNKKRIKEQENETEKVTRKIYYFDKPKKYITTLVTILFTSLLNTNKLSKYKDIVNRTMTYLKIKKEKKLVIELI